MFIEDPLHMCFSRTPIMSHFFLWLGMDVETRLGFEWTPLMCAVHVGHCELAELLLDRGASANFSRGEMKGYKAIMFSEYSD